MGRGFVELIVGFIIATVYFGITELLGWGFGTFAIGGLVLVAVMGLTGRRLHLQTIGDMRRARGSATEGPHAPSR